MLQQQEDWEKLVQHRHAPIMMNDVKSREEP